MFEVSFPRQGAVLNRHSGVESADGLEITVRGFCNESGVIRVNGVVAEMHGAEFFCKCKLTECFNKISVSLADDFGTLTREMQVVWDKGSFKRYDFFIDDNIFFLTDLAKERPKSLFDHFYLSFLKKMHDTYGTLFSLNLFYNNAYEPFTLSDMPDIYKSEWKDNSHWLKMAFHAYSEFPDRPYQNTPPEKIGEDYDLVCREIERFAGRESLIEMEALHWAMARPSAFSVLHKRGVRLLEGQFLCPRTGIADGGEQELICDVGYFRNLNDARFLEESRMLYDFRNGMLFWRNDCTSNLVSVEDSIARIKAVPRDTLGLATHEQYSFPRYFNYLPDHFERMEAAIRTADECGFKPVFFARGIMGNTAWGDKVL